MDKKITAERRYQKRVARNAVKAHVKTPFVFDPSKDRSAIYTMVDSEAFDSKRIADATERKERKAKKSLI